MTKKDGITVREAELRDEAAADRLVKAQFPNDPHTYAANIRYPSECINVVAESAGVGIVGYASMLIEASPEHGPQEWRKFPLYVGVVVVRPEYRGCGTGTRLLQLLLDRARVSAPHHDSMHLHVNQQNEPAVRCFEKFGFYYSGEIRSGQGRHNILAHASPRPKLGSAPRDIDPPR